MDIYAQHIELCNEVLRHADPARWDRDEAIDAIAVDYVRDLEARLELSREQWRVLGEALARLARRRAEYAAEGRDAGQVQHEARLDDEAAAADELLELWDR